MVSEIFKFRPVENEKLKLISEASDILTYCNTLAQTVCVPYFDLVHNNITPIFCLAAKIKQTLSVLFILKSIEEHLSVSRFTNTISTTSIYSSARTLSVKFSNIVITVRSMNKSIGKRNNSKSTTNIYR